MPKGTYELWTIPARDGWQLMIQRESATDAQEAAPYDTADALARVDLRVERMASPLESLTMWLIPSTAPGTARGELRIGWGTTLLSTDWALR